MNRGLLKKGLVIGVILCLFGLSVIPSNANVIEKRSDPIVNQNISSNYTNYLGTMYVNFSRFSSEIGFKLPENTNYSFPVVTGNYTLNFTVEVNITFNQILLFPRGIYTYTLISINNTPIWAAFGVNFIHDNIVFEWIIKDIDRNFTNPPINGTEKVNLSIFIQGRCFPFGFFKPKETSFAISVRFIDE